MIQSFKKQKLSTDGNNQLSVPSSLIEAECERDDVDASLDSPNEVSILLKFHRNC